MPVDRRGSDKSLGLKAVEEARDARAKQFRPSVRVGLWFGMIVAVFTVLRWRCTLSEMDEQRTVLLAKQRTVEAELGPRWYPLRDKVEAWAGELAREPGEQVIRKEELAKIDVRSTSGLYLRTRVDQAASPELVREAAKRSLRDAFTSCLRREADASPVKGVECKRTRECPGGEFCNELNHCGPPTQPYNLRSAYRTLSMLSPDWVADVQDTTNDLRLELLIRSFEDATVDDLPLAAHLLTRATYFLLVLDERPPTRALSPEEIDAGAADAEDEDTLAGASYPSRVALWRLEDGQLLLRMRRTSDAELVGGAPVKDPAVAAARRRQAQSCGLALEVRAALGESIPTAPPRPEDPAPPASAAPTASAAASVAPSAGTSASPSVAAPLSTAAPR